MKNAILKIFKTKTFSHTLISVSGTVTNGLLGLAFYAFLARFIGPTSYGILIISFTVLALIADIFNFGTNTGIVNFVGKYISHDKAEAYRFMKLGLKMNICVGLVVLLSGWFFMPTVARLVFNKPDISFPLQIALIGSFGGLLFSFMTSSLQALQKFTSWSFLNVSMNFLRLLLVVGLFILGGLTINNTLLVYLAPLFIGALLGFIILPRFWQVTNENKVLTTFVNYNKWIALFTVIAALSSRLDTLISGRLLNFHDVGIYSVANNLTSVIPQIVVAIASVIAPKLASFQQPLQALTYLKKINLFVGSLAIMGVLVGVPAGIVIIPTLYGNSYSASIIPFIILLLSQALFLFSIPAHTAVIYYFSKPKLFVWMNVAHIFIVSIAGWLLISRFGYTGAAFAVLLGSISNYLIPTLWVVRKFQQK